MKGDNAAGVKTAKERITVLLCASATGEKLKPLVIGRSANPRCFRGLNMSPEQGSGMQKANTCLTDFGVQYTKKPVELKRELIYNVYVCMFVYGSSLSHWFPL